MRSSQRARHLWPWLLPTTVYLASRASTPQPAPVMTRDAAPAVARQPRHHVVQPGENLYRIALEHGLDYRDLARSNDLKNPDRLPAGTRLRLEPPAPEANTPMPDPVRWGWPVQGKVIAEFDPKRGRKGLHIAAPYGSPVRVAADGQVVYTGQALRG